MSMGAGLAMGLAAGMAANGCNDGQLSHATVTALSVCLVLGFLAAIGSFVFGLFLGPDDVMEGVFISFVIGVVVFAMGALFWCVWEAIMYLWGVL